MVAELMPNHGSYLVIGVKDREHANRDCHVTLAGYRCSCRGSRFQLDLEAAGLTKVGRAEWLGSSDQAFGNGTEQCFRLRDRARFAHRRSSRSNDRSSRLKLSRFG
jgi:hypothetical protein